jgi:c-di-GMP-binding flagellar brake protein YcgR
MRAGDKSTIWVHPMGATEQAAGSKAEAGQQEEQSVSFEQMNLQVGSRIQLVSFRGKKLTSFASMIGWETNQYLLATIPKENGVNMPLNVGERVDVRFFSGVSIYIFSSCVQFLYYNPRPFIELVFPGHIHHVPLRRDMRIALTMPVTITQSTSNQKAATAVDLSSAGMMLHSEAQLGQVGDPIGMSFAVRNTVAKEDVQIQASGIIRNIRTKDGATPPVYMHGVSFEQLPSTSLVILQNYIYETILGKRTA